MTEAVQAVVGSIMVVGALTYWALLHCEWFESQQMNVQSSQIRELRLYEFEQGHNAAESNKNICCTKGDGAVDHCTVVAYWPLTESSLRDFSEWDAPV